MAALTLTDANEAHDELLARLEAEQATSTWATAATRRPRIDPSVLTIRAILSLLTNLVDPHDELQLRPRRPAAEAR